MRRHVRAPRRSPPAGGEEWEEEGRRRENRERGAKVLSGVDRSEKWGGIGRCTPRRRSSHAPLSSSQVVLLATTPSAHPVGAGATAWGERSKKRFREGIFEGSFRKAARSRGNATFFERKEEVSSNSSGYRSYKSRQISSQLVLPFEWQITTS